MALKSGIPINRVFDSLAKSASTSRLRIISRGMKDEIEAGSSLAQAFKKYNRDFPEMFVSLMAVGEQTGHIEEVAAQLAEYYQRRYSIISKMKWELLFIGFYFLLLLSLVVFILYVRSGWDVRVIYDFLARVAICVIFFILIPWAFYRNLRSFRIVVQTIIQSLPLLGRILNQFCLSRFASSMALGLRTGMEIRETIRFSAAAMGSPLLERRALKAIDYIEGGSSIAESLVRTRVFPTLINYMYETGEQSGRLFEMMERVAVVSREQAENALKIFIKIFTTLAYLCVLLFIAYMIIGLWTGIIGDLPLSN